MTQHRPEPEILRSPQAQFTAGELSIWQSERLRNWCEAVLTRVSNDASVWWNVACFFRGSNAGRWLAYLRRAADLDPGNALYGRELGLLYGGVLLTAKNRRGVELGMSVEEARRELDRTSNAATLEAAVRLLRTL